MLIKINFEKFINSDQKLGLCVDITMLILISINLIWLLFDLLFASQWIQSGLHWLHADFTDWYRTNIHPNFFSYELIFIAVYWIEFLIRWIISTVRSDHYRFWFYPFIRWYDILGALPIASFRFLRLLRLISVIRRLQTTGIVDFSDTPLGRFIRKYKTILVEEVSDQVVVNVLENVKNEIAQGQPIMHRLIQEVLLPKRYRVGVWTSNRVTDWIAQIYLVRQHEVATYIKYLVNNAVTQSKGIDRLATIPIVGKQLQVQLENAIAEITFTVIDQLLQDLHSDRCTQYIQEAVAVLLQHASLPESEFSILLEQALSQALNVIIDEVKIKKWQQQEKE